MCASVINITRRWPIRKSEVETGSGIPVKILAKTVISSSLADDPDFWSRLTNSTITVNYQTIISGVMSKKRFEKDDKFSAQIVQLFPPYTWLEEIFLALFA